MKKSRAVLLSLMIGAGAISPVHADSFFTDAFSLERKKEIAPVTSEAYRKGCGECHFLYQPGLLPEQSWRKLLDAKALEDHFGENAELSDKDRIAILEFLVANSAEKSNYKRSKKIMASLQPGEAPLRIIEVPYIKRKHNEIPEDLIKKNDKVKSLSYCDKCHQQADKNSFDDDAVNIPGHGNWTW
ncbi:MAG: Diheme Cytochrome C [Gammaproteobacteria bacterium]|nr:MAG: Diheme Cytochrome C [Gammaproteobacteria bacterium]TND02482.1 MAG: Diheme Cytochrome C [Gammaproteobacteria bacterium]